MTTNGNLGGHKLTDVIVSLEIHRAIVPVKLSSGVGQILHVAVVVLVRFAVRVIVGRARTVVVVQKVRIVAQHLVHFLSGQGGRKLVALSSKLGANYRQSEFIKTTANIDSPMSSSNGRSSVVYNYGRSLIGKLIIEINDFH